MRKYAIEGTNLKLLCRSTDVWHRADVLKLLGYKNTTIYITRHAYMRASVDFMKQCIARNIELVVVRRERCYGIRSYLKHI